jgi:hypothetical protein
VDPFSNPLRWGTMYNFWFDADAPPVETTATVGLFKPGSPATLSGSTLGPIVATIPGDINGDGVVNVNDLVALIGVWGPCPPPPAGCPADLDNDGSVAVDDLVLLIGNWS